MTTDKEPLELAANSVSIHARHCWRANPRLAISAAMVAAFQSTPAIAGGRIPFARNALPRNGFCWYLREPGGTVLCFA